MVFNSIKGRNVGFLDYFVNKFNIKLNDRHFYEARGREMVSHLFNKYGLPNDEVEEVENVNWNEEVENEVEEED